MDLAGAQAPSLAALSFDQKVEMGGIPIPVGQGLMQRRKAPPADAAADLVDRPLLKDEDTKRLAID